MNAEGALLEVRDATWDVKIQASPRLRSFLLVDADLTGTFNTPTQYGLVGWLHRPVWEAELEAAILSRHSRMSNISAMDTELATQREGSQLGVWAIGQDVPTMF